MVPEDPTFLFADLAGFTALTEVHGDLEAADIVGGFASEVRSLLGPHAAREVKTIGDALMLVCSDPAEAIRLGLRITRDIGDSHAMPSVRVGMHTGTAVERDGDFIGASVNIAARISAAAGGGRVILSEATMRAAGSLPDVAFHGLGAHTFRNVGEPLTLFEALWRSERREGESLPIDPVCRMAVDPAHEVGVLSFAGTEYHFCSLECTGAFATHPGRYVGAPLDEPPGPLRP